MSRSLNPVVAEMNTENPYAVTTCPPVARTIMLPKKARVLLSICRVLSIGAVVTAVGYVAPGFLRLLYIYGDAPPSQFVVIPVSIVLFTEILGIWLRSVSVERAATAASITLSTALLVVILADPRPSDSKFVGLLSFGCVWLVSSVVRRWLIHASRNMSH
ncbi:MAG: hypothetical protein R3C19_15375 [Planctomycetaceae bacterium]